MQAKKLNPQPFEAAVLHIPSNQIFYSKEAVAKAITAENQTDITILLSPGCCDLNGELLYRGDKIQSFAPGHAGKLGFIGYDMEANRWFIEFEDMELAYLVSSTSVEYYEKQ